MKNFNINIVDNSQPQAVVDQDPDMTKTICVFMTS